MRARLYRTTAWGALLAGVSAPLAGAPPATSGALMVAAWLLYLCSRIARS